jgi:histidine ammonia-lyase
VALDGGLTPAAVAAVAAGTGVRYGPEAQERLRRQRAVIDAAVAQGQPVYGVTTGLGARVTDALPAAVLAEQSLRTLRGRANGLGPPLPDAVVRATMAVRANQMAAGGSGVQPAVVELLVQMLNRGVIPVVPSLGSISAGDLCQLAHLGLVLAGEGRAVLRPPDADAAPSEPDRGDRVLAAAGLRPVELGPRDGLALCSSSALSAALGALALHAVETVLDDAYQVAALSCEGFRANLSPIDPGVLRAHPAPGQDRAAGRLREALRGSLLLRPGAARRLQDPLSWRCLAQVHGALEAALSFAGPAVDAEVNGSSDNPVVVEDDPAGASARILSSGNFQPTTLALALDTVALGLHQVAALSVNRIQRFLAPALTGLPANLSPHGPERSGFAPMVKVAQAVLAQIRRQAAPAYDDPRSGAADVEDNSTNAALGGQRLLEMATAVRSVFAMEALVAAQAVDLAAPERLGDGPAELLRAVRERVVALDEDRSSASDIAAVTEVLLARH